MTGELIIHRGGRLEQSRGCPDHLTVGAIERCTRCMQILHERMAQRRRLDEADRDDGIDG